MILVRMYREWIFKILKATPGCVIYLTTSKEDYIHSAVHTESMQLTCREIYMCAYTQHYTMIINNYYLAHCRLPHALTLMVTLPFVTFLMLKPTVGIMSSLNCPLCI